ncbi:potassium-transporting ATPase subunit KdpC [Sphingobium sp. KCTC 72723]|uniref:potassium-transporting ATPase subunit KdpC n=1 Tax=Sphingobium sp. KCTC 72723 TaxID=2733867 RepID=UPI00165D49F3|nr:potassium-transporting ATPase subunit KdpC [Sphingobium sp. KCTC 72723]
MGKDIVTSLRPALVLTLLFALLLGIAYPLAMTGVGQMVFPRQANGSLIEAKGRVIGSSLIGQAFADPRYFTGRPSAAGAGYDAMASSGSNLGPTSQALVDRVKGDVARLKDTAPDFPVPPDWVPGDLVTASASGLDPHISPEAAFYQVGRVAAARQLPVARVRALVEGAVETPIAGFIGAPRVNVLELNRQLDAIGDTPAR